MKKFNPEKHHRRSIRLKDYDYACPGAYFVTICTFQRESILGEVIDDRVQLSEMGSIVQWGWKSLPEHYNVQLDGWIVMPNHVHGIIILPDLKTEKVRAGLRPAPTKIHGLPEIVRSLKSFSSRKINELRDSPGVPVWQRNYYEHVIRNERSLNEIRWYIKHNPSRWMEDYYYEAIAK